jgi:ribosome-associated translation inhibitor RaiA
MAQFQITFRGMTPSDALRSVAQEKFDKLSRKFGRSASCSIVIGHAGGAEHGKAAFAARVELQADEQRKFVHAAAEHVIATCAVREAFERATVQVIQARAEKRAPRAHALVVLRAAQ